MSCWIETRGSGRKSGFLAKGRDMGADCQESAYV